MYFDAGVFVYSYLTTKPSYFHPYPQFEDIKVQYAHFFMGGNKPLLNFLENLKERYSMHHFKYWLHPCCSATLSVKKRSKELFPKAVHFRLFYTPAIGCSVATLRYLAKLTFLIRLEVH